MYFMLFCSFQVQIVFIKDSLQFQSPNIINLQLQSNMNDRPTILTNLLLLITTTTLTYSSMLITSPAINPFDQSLVPYSYSNIGTIPYGKTLTFDLVDSGDLDLCKKRQVNDTVEHFTDPTYLLVDTTLGTCSYTTEAINAQELGVKGVVFVSDIVNYYDKIVQVDDGNGRKVHITVLFINTHTYRKLYTLKNIHIKVQFQTHQTSKVNIKYFLSASGRTNYIFLRQFKPYFIKLKDYINFQPSYLTIKCPHCKMTQCYVTTDYCTFEMDYYEDDMGEYVLREQLRQWSVWEGYGSQKYMEYMDLFDKFCDGNWMGSEECGDGVMVNIGLQKRKMDKAPTGVMDEWRIQQQSAGFLSTPQLTINSQLYPGTYQPQQLFTAICESLISPPEACTGISPQQQSNDKILWIIAAIVLASILTLGAGYFVYKKCVKEELTKDMYSKVNELVAKYATEVQEHNKKRKNKAIMRLNDQL